MSAQSSLVWRVFRVRDFLRVRIPRIRWESEGPRLEQAQKHKTRKCAHVFHRRSPCAQTTLANAHYAERFTANPETSKNSARTPRGRTTLLASESERLTRLCGTGVPYPAAPRFHSVLLCSGSEDPSNCSLPRDTSCPCPARTDTTRLVKALTKHRV